MCTSPWRCVQRAARPYGDDVATTPKVQSSNVQCRFSGNSDSNLSRCLSERGENLKETGAGAQGRRGEGGGCRRTKARWIWCMRMPHLPPPNTLGSTKNRNPVLYIWFSVDPPILMFFLISRSGPEIIQILLQFVFLQHPCPIQHPRCLSHFALFFTSRRLRQRFG